MKLSTAAREALNQDPRYTSIGNLPSNYVPYSYTDLMIRPLTVHEMKLISKAGVTRDEEYLMRAVDLCISEDIMDLTQGDYYYVLMWLRINSSPKTPYAVTWKCPDSFYQNVVSGEIIKNDKTRWVPDETQVKDYKVVKCDTSNTELIHMTTLEILQFPDEVEPLGPEFDFPRVGIIKEVRELMEDPELQMLLPAVQWVRGATVKDRLAFLEKQPDTDILMEALALEHTLVHGIKETCTLHCRTCRAEHPFTINLEPLSFFR